MIDICFVILNYNLYKETMACVQSIYEYIDTESFKIIIVDNASPNGTGNKLYEYYFNDDIVEVIQLRENIGFARGNNVGIKRAREEGAKFICCINDDAELRSNDFYTIIDEKYKQYQPALIGPQVINRAGNIHGFNHPLHAIDQYEELQKRLCEETYEEYKKKQRITFKYRIRRNVDRYRLTRALFQKINLQIKGIDPYAPKTPKYTKDTEDLVLCGCCLIFTPAFFSCLSGFNESTFLYYEEEFLQASLMINHLHSLYVPEIEIYHKEGMSTGPLIGKKGEQKWRRTKEYGVESLQMFISFIKENEKEIYRDELGF